MDLFKHNHLPTEEKLKEVDCRIQKFVTEGIRSTHS